MPEQDHISQALYFVAQKGWTNSGRDFFSALTRYLGEQFDFDYVLLGTLKGDDNIETISLFVKGDIVPNIEYELAGSPCENVVGNDMCTYEQGIQQLFPQDALLGEMGADGYVGIPLWSSTGDPIGLIACLHSQPLQNVPAIQSVLQIVASRASAELERLQLEAQLVQSRKMEAIGTLAGGIAHDFNNLLSIIIGNIEIIQRKGQLAAPCDKNIANIKDASNRAKELITQILSFSRQEKPSLKPISCTDLVDGVVALLRPTIPASVELLKQQDVQSLFIKGDSTQLQQVMINLCMNSVHAINDKGLISISLASVELRDGEVPVDSECPPGRYAEIRVSDNGCGIEPQTLQKIFDPFFTTKGPGEGTGMGLSVAHGIIDLHGGFITVESTTAKGTSVCVYLPEIENTGTTELQEIKSLLTGTERILFVDDEELLLESSKALLEELGYEVVTASSGKDALRIFRSKPDAFDLIYTDQTMLGLSGTELAVEILKIKPDIPIVLCTGYTTKIKAEDAKRLGIREFCMKPMDIEQFSIVSRKALSQSSS